MSTQSSPPNSRLATGVTRLIVMILITLAAAMLLIMPPAAMPPDMAVAGALVLVTIGMLATGSMPEQLVVLVFFLSA